MIERNEFGVDRLGFHFEKLRSLLPRVNNPQQTIADFNREAYEHIDQIKNSANHRSYISFYFRQRSIPDWDRERPADIFRSLAYYRIDEEHAEFMGRIPQTTIMRRLEGIEARPVKLGRAIAFFFTPESDMHANAILSSPRRNMETPTIPDMTLYQFLI